MLSGTPASQLFSINGTPQLVIGVPLPAVHAAYFEVFSLDELAGTLRTLAFALAAAALVTTVAGAVARPLGQRAGPAPAVRGDRGRGGHRRRPAGHPGGGRATTSTSRSWPRRSTR